MLSLAVLLTALLSVLLSVPIAICQQATSAISVLNDPRVSVRCYDINGLSEAELRADMKQHGPIDLTGARADAFTLWRIDWRWPRQGDLRRINVDVQVIVTVPCWQNAESGSRELRRWWDQFEQAIIIHEAGHIEHVLQGSKRIADAVTAAANERSDLSADEANRIAYSIIRELQDFDLIYDSITQNGRRQGVIFH